MKKILFMISHPAHFHLFRYTILNLRQHGHELVIVIRPKDVLEQLCIDAGFSYIKVKDRPDKGGLIRLAFGLMEKVVEVMRIARKTKPDMLMGSDGVLAYVGSLLRIPSFVCDEDDAEATPLFAKLFYPFFTALIEPDCTSAGKWNKKKIGYPSYHELSYLHPHQFKPDKQVVAKYGIDSESPYFVIRFVKLSAHHDVGVHGISTEVAQRVIEMLKPHGRIYITSERPLEPSLEPYRIHISPLDMHHVMAFASLYIGDSQTMAAEAGVMGVPFVRLNDFVGRLSYLHELEAPTDYMPRSNGFVPTVDAHVPEEKHYCLGYGHKSADIEGFYQSVEKWLAMPNRTVVCHERMQRMLAEKIDLAQFLTWFIEHYPQSAEEAKGRDAHDPFWDAFR